MSQRVFAALLLAGMALSSAARAQQSPQSANLGQSMFDQELQEASNKLSSLMVIVGGAHRPTGVAAMEIREKLFSTIKVLHHIEEDARGVNLELERGGSETNRNLSLIAATCRELALADEETEDYIDTGDSVFWDAAVNAKSMALKMVASR